MSAGGVTDGRIGGIAQGGEETRGCLGALNEGDPAARLGKPASKQASKPASQPARGEADSLFEHYLDRLADRCRGSGSSADSTDDTDDTAERRPQDRKTARPRTSEGTSEVWWFRPLFGRCETLS